MENNNQKIYCKECCREISEETSKQYDGYCKNCYNEKHNIPSQHGYIKYIIIAIVLLCILIPIIIEIYNNKKLEKKFNSMGSSAYNFIDGTYNSSNSHLNEFYYDYKTNTVIYNGQK